LPANGEDDGTIHAELDPTYLGRLFAEATPMPHVSLLIGGDGEVLAGASDLLLNRRIQPKPAVPGPPGRDAAASPSEFPIRVPSDPLPPMPALPPPIRVNRAPVLTLWAIVVAERLG
jgi:hypothetical protein